MVDFYFNLKLRKATTYKRAHKWKKKRKKKEKRKEKKYTVEVIHNIPQYRMAIETYPVFYERLTDMWLSTLEIGGCSVDSLRYIKWRRNNHSSGELKPYLIWFSCMRKIYPV